MTTRCAGVCRGDQARHSRGLWPDVGADNDGHRGARSRRAWGLYARVVSVADFKHLNPAKYSVLSLKYLHCEHNSSRVSDCALLTCQWIGCFCVDITLLGGQSYVNQMALTASNAVHTVNFFL